MNVWMLLQILVDLILVAALMLLWAKSRKKPREDSRFSRGLQMLSSKIAVLEDLSDKTEVQVGQLSGLIEQKSREVQSKIDEAEKQIRLIDQSMAKSLEVAQIFQDKIPHEEIIERQKMIKYIKAATLAHQGSAAEDIAEKVSLSLEEIEFIIKVNQGQLIIPKEDVPAWAEGALKDPEQTSTYQVKTTIGIEPAAFRKIDLDNPSQGS